MLDSIAARALGTLALTLALTAPFTNAEDFAKSSSVNLLSYMSSNIQDTVDTNSIPKYNRLKQFGGWVKQNGCFDTRESALARDEDSSVEIKYTKSGCTIASGLWHDPYTGTEFKDATQLQIDHVVPLKTAYYAGAYQWESAKRCNYANFLANGYHLASVSGHENMSKGDRGPDGYLPPDHNDRCTYVSNWMKIKTIWQLSTTTAEINAIKDVIAQERCDSKLLSMDQSDLDKQRAKAKTPISQCANFGATALVAELVASDKE